MSAIKQQRQRRTTARRASTSQATPGVRRSFEQWIRNGKLLAGLLVAGAIAFLAFAMTSERFHVAQVDVLNSQLQPAEDVAALSAVEGQSLWLVDPQLVARKVSTSAYLESAAVSLALPDRVIIQVQERLPAIRWSAGGTEYLVDAQAVVLGPAAQPDPLALTVYDTSSPTLASGDHLDPDAMALARALSIRLPQDLQLTPQRIEWNNALGVYIIMPDGRQVVFGRIGDKQVPLDVKIATLRQVLAENLSFQFLDLRPTLPYYR